MSKFDNKLFDALTSNEEIFKSAIEIVEQFQFIKEKLINDYWDAVISELNHLFAINKHEFIIDIIYGNLYISLKKDDSIYVCLEDIEAQQTLGLYVEYNKIKGKINFKNYVENISLEGFEIYNDEWCAIKSLNDDLSMDAWILRILPFKRESFVKEKARDLFNFVIMQKRHLDYIKAHFL